MRGLVRDAGLGRGIVIGSAGTGAWHVGELPDPRTRAAASARGLELTSKARLFVQADFDRFDYMLAMDLSNLQTLQRMARTSHERSKIHLLRSFDPTAPAQAEVPDPYYGGPGGFDEVLDMCERACRGLLAHLHAQHALSHASSDASPDAKADVNADAALPPA